MFPWKFSPSKELTRLVRTHTLRESIIRMNPQNVFWGKVMVNRLDTVCRDLSRGQVYSSWRLNAWVPHDHRLCSNLLGELTKRKLQPLHY